MRPCPACGQLTAKGSYCGRPCTGTGQRGSTRAWRRVRAEALHRAGYTCEEHGCHMTQGLEVHHVRSKHQGGSDDLAKPRGPVPTLPCRRAGAMTPGANPSLVKRCKRCEELPSNAFSRHRATLDGRGSYCKGCARRADNAERRGSGYVSKADARDYDAILRADPCSYCGLRVSDHVDHVDPRIESGGEGWENMTAACLSCNASKGRRTLLFHMGLQVTRSQLAEVMRDVMDWRGVDGTVVKVRNAAQGPRSRPDSLRPHFYGHPEFLRCGKQRIYDLVSQRRLPHLKDGSRVLLRRTELLAYLGGPKP